MFIWPLPGSSGGSSGGDIGPVQTAVIVAVLAILGMATIGVIAMAIYYW
jgi:hypothetical protein